MAAWEKFLALSRELLGEPAHILSDAAAEMILAKFKRRIRVELDLLTLECERNVDL